jgi:hypothetical protein
VGWLVCPASVAVVASPGQEAEGHGLERFLVERGIEAVRVPSLPAPAALAEVRDAVVLFTKGFELDASRRWLDEVLAADAGRLVVVVAASLPAFADLARPDRVNVLLLAAPVLAWQLVDVLRNHLAGRARGPEPATS